MSTRSKVKRQVRCNAREAPKARARRLSASRWQWAWARWPSAAAIHTATMSTMLAADAKAWREMFTSAIAGGDFMVLPDGVEIEIVAVNTPGGSYDGFREVVARAEQDIARTILGRTS